MSREGFVLLSQSIMAGFLNKVKFEVRIEVGAFEDTPISYIFWAYKLFKK
jgi:hypothetical protein